MAPAARNRRHGQHSQPTLSSFARVSKSTITSKSEKSKQIAAKQFALESLENEQKPPRKLAAPIEPPKKRKRPDTDSEDDVVDTIEFFSSSKRTKIQLQSPSRVSKAVSTPATLSASQELDSIHRAFLKAFALHHAHNGRSAPAELSTLLQSITRLYQKRAVTTTDLQRVLGLYEFDGSLRNASNTVEHRIAPFKLCVSGIGMDRRYLVEFVGYSKQIQRNGRSLEEQVDMFMEHDLSYHWNKNILQNAVKFSILQDCPLLAFAVGTQTIVRQNRTTETMKHIMSGRKSDLSMDGLTIRDSQDTQTTQSCKSRTLSLFDRVKAKQLANATINVPSADALCRKHAIARMAEVVEILRMKQQQKLNGYRGAGSGGKVSFAMQQIVNEIRASMATPMSEDEIKKCIEILAKEGGDAWCTVFEVGSAKSVVLAGKGKSGAEMAKLIPA